MAQKPNMGRCSIDFQEKLFQLKPRNRERGSTSLVVASERSGSSSESKSGSERFYLNFTGFPFPLGPFLNRRTIRTEAVKGCIWLFEQEQALGFSSVSTNIRMTVIKLKSGGLWIHAPIAPTKECIQWSWPINLPLEFFGIFRAKSLKDEDTSTPWADEIEQKVLSSPEVGIGPYVEVAFFHKRSRTLLVTDAVIFVPRQPPECISNKSLLASAKNGLAVKLLSKGKEVLDEPVVDNKLNRQKGPSNLLEPTASFSQMSQKLIVSPIIKTLVFSKVPEKVRDWADRIAKDWRFRRIIPAHFAAPINASRSDFLASFAFLDELLEERFVTKPSLSLLFTTLMERLPLMDMGDGKNPEYN
ncbi:hypothetical protein QJS10_CPA10g02037 [Acorus calamus]|uniref:Uncharacterized protein n=1 Tax=Acorus calamus TaxID=4465 RepID=A0AAV9DYQ3_ACOCL|nr:hypothetical protein QJS10_CPA10g02037 [Acorus calamus]